MLADVKRGVATEVDVLNGSIVAMAKSIGSSAPLNAQIVRKMRSLEKRRRLINSRKMSTDVYRSVESMQQARAVWSSSNERIGFVPTMGGLHDGHLSLVKTALSENDRVVVSIYVNPTQFGANEDLEKYPKSLSKDIELLKGLNDRVSVFAPEASLYSRNFISWVIPDLAATGENMQRAVHFKGVATVVLMLLNIVRPSRAYFGQKDGQQCLVVKALARDFFLNSEVIICPTIREADGLAMSTRNQYLTAEQRTTAPLLYRSLREIAALCPASAATLKSHFATLLASHGDCVTTQYISISNNENGSELSDGEMVGNGDEILLSAAIGFPGSAVRILDNIVVGRDNHNTK